LLTIFRFASFVTALAILRGTWKLTITVGSLSMRQLKKTY